MECNIKLKDKILKSKGYKLTKPRRAIIECIYKNSRHLDVKYIYECTKDKGVGLTTIYRNLSLLKKLDIINEVIIDNVKYYEPKYVHEDYNVHMKCEKCSRIFDIKHDKLLDNLVGLNLSIEDRCGVKINNLNIVISGTCDECNGKSNME